MLFKIGKILVAIFVIWLFLLVVFGVNLFYYFFPPPCLTFSDVYGESSPSTETIPDHLNELVVKTLIQSEMCIPMSDLD